MSQKYNNRFLLINFIGNLFVQMINVVNATIKVFLNDNSWLNCLQHVFITGATIK